MPALKDMYDHALVKRMANALLGASPDFRAKEFLRVSSGFADLEMKDRVRLIRDELRRFLPDDYRKAVTVLRRSAQAGALKGFDIWPYTEFVQTFGLDDLELSLETLKEFTQLFTSEWAVRPFLRLHPERTRAFLIECASDRNVHVRRWASEGSRPRLPWGERLHELVHDPSPNLEILELLKFDKEPYVRKSVANHLNDVTKDHPEWVCRLLKKWRKEATEADQSTLNWITHRALRTLIKNGHPQALRLIGVEGPARLTLDFFRIRAGKIRLGEELIFEFQISSKTTRSQKLVIDYILHFRKANGQRSAKVFKLKSLALDGQTTALITKTHAIKPVTTRTYYPGIQALEIQINGASLGRKNWRLL